MKFNHKNRRTIVITCLLLSIGTLLGCKKFLDIPLPVDKISADGAYISDNSTSSVVTGILSNMASSSAYGAPNNNEPIGYRTGLYTDELLNIRPTEPANLAFYTNNIQSTNSSQWTPLYKIVYNCNIAIENIRSTKANLISRNQWLGEALFCRAFNYFYLVNLYGDIPFTISSDFKANNILARSPKSVVYQQIISDLKEAQGLLGADYLDGFASATSQRARPNKSAADALLARAYLYTGDWANAETEATKVINATGNFQLVAPAVAFLANSRETIFALAPITINVVRDYGLYNNSMPAVVANQVVASTFVTTALSNSLVNLFEPGDTRFTNWVRATAITTPASTYYFPNKYKSSVNGTEYLIALRLGEQYLIRAEARARLNNLSGAATDLNAVRTRAGLAGTNAADQTSLITAILRERQVELFTEFGHRFFDLKRTGLIDGVMNVVSPQKGGSWNSQKQIWPIPANDILIDPNITQAPGYN